MESDGDFGLKWTTEARSVICNGVSDSLVRLAQRCTASHRSHSWVFVDVQRNPIFSTSGPSWVRCRNQKRSWDPSLFWVCAFACKVKAKALADSHHQEDSLQSRLAEAYLPWIDWEWCVSLPGSSIIHCTMTICGTICCDISLSWWCSCSFDGIDGCYLLCE
jgi:hypothetical protein